MKYARQTLRSMAFAVVSLLYINDYLVHSVSAQTVASNPEPNGGSTTLTTTNTLSSTSVPTTSFPCEYDRIDATFMKGMNRNVVNYTPSNPQAPSCILSTIYSFIPECQAYGNNLAALYKQQYPAVTWVDDCIAWKIFGAKIHSYKLFYNSNFTADQTYLNFGNKSAWAGFSINSRGIVSSAKHAADQYDLDVDLRSTLYIRRNANGSCTGVSGATIPADVSLCYAGTYTWYSSPISLLWDNQVDIDHELRFTTFPIDPHQDGSQWNVWKASAKAPLLVYDPEHRGHISSGTQLFGNWTFGGRTIATLEGSGASMVDTAKPYNVKWNNGYEALAILDINKDGKINGIELSPLGLWFDKDRDGISDSGEVKRLEEMGIITLFYNPNRKESGTKSIYADRGFERIEDGKIISGGSVDWWSDAAPAKSELINKHLAAAMGCHNAAEEHNSMIFESTNVGSAITQTSPYFKKLINAKASSRYSKLQDRAYNISGLWEWKSEDTKGEPEGLIGFKDMKDGRISGHTYTTFGVNNNAASFSHIVSALHFSGEKSVLKNGQLKIKFTVQPDRTSFLENEAIYDPRTKKLIGKTLAKVSMGTRAMDLTYRWVASKVQTPLGSEQ